MHFSKKSLAIIAMATFASAVPIVSVVDIVERDGVSFLVERGSELPEVTKRQIAGCSTSTEYKWVPADNPDPHQNFVFKQITPSMQCKNAPGNAAEVSKGESVGWSFNVGGTFGINSGTGAYGAGLDIGYSISESVEATTTQVFGCASDEGSKDLPVCGFQRVQVTAYTVKEKKCKTVRGISSTCGGGTICSDTGKTGVVFAPNADQGGSSTSPGNCYYDTFQLGLPCVSVGHEIRSNPSSIPGGPQWVSCTDPRSAPGQ